MAGSVTSGLVLILSILTGKILSQTVPPDSWTTENYPNPQTQPEICGSDRDDVEYVCDPNSILSAVEASQLEQAIQELMDETECPCAQYTCDNEASLSYRVGVAIMKQMNTTSPNSQTNSGSPGVMIDTSLSDAKIFAHTFLSRWGLGRCGEDMVIVYSQNDAVVYTAVGSETEKKLDGELIAEISQNVQRLLTPYSTEKMSGLKTMISNYKAVLKGQYERKARVIVPPKFGAVVGSSAKVTTFSLMVVTMTLFAALF